jgi:histone acetyltransferase (RNA polymerase elongator complex component)
MKPYIIPIFIPNYGCQHRCIFCNQRQITGVNAPVGAEQVTAILNEHLARIRRPRVVEMAFYGGSFTALPIAQQQQLLAPAYQALVREQIQAIRVSTRPDAINDDVIRLLQRCNVSTVELGVQSLDEQVLAAAGRGHSVEVVSQAVAMVKAAGLACGIQLMPGLPGEDWLSFLLTAKRAAALQANFARIYPTIVIAGTELAELYRQGRYLPLPFQDAIRRCAFLKVLLQRHGTKVIRTGLQATPELSLPGVVLDGPYHPAFGEMVDSYLFYIMVAGYLEQAFTLSPEIVIHHHPRDHSKLRGTGNSNLHKWQANYGPITIRFCGDGAKEGELQLATRHRLYFINIQMLLDL